MDVQELTVTTRCRRPLIFQLAAYYHFFNEKLVQWLVRKSFEVT